MILTFEVQIKLHPNGTWEIVDGEHYDSDGDISFLLEGMKPSTVRKTSNEILDEVFDGDCGLMDEDEKSAQWLLDNAKYLRKAGSGGARYQNGGHAHCSLCGECGKKRQTHRACMSTGAHYHTGAPFRGEKCKGGEE